MPVLSIDTDVARSMRRECIGNLTWLGFLLGRRAAGEVFGYVLVPPTRQTQIDVEVSRFWAEALSRAVQSRGNGSIELMGIVHLTPFSPDRHTVRLGQREWEGTLGGGVLMYVAEPDFWRQGRRLSGYRMVGSAKLSIREVAALGQRHAVLIEDIIEDLWSELDEHSDWLPRSPGLAFPRPQRCVLDAEVEQALLDAAGHHRHREVGGVLLGLRSRLTTRVVAALFPPQFSSDVTRCEFESHTLSGISDALEELGHDPDSGVAAGLKPVGWIHTHPHHGVFLSPVDRTTFRKWAALDPRAVAVVVDPFASQEQRMAWNGDFQPVIIHQPRDVSPNSFGGTEAAQLVEAVAGRTGSLAGHWRLVYAGGCITEKADPPAARAETSQPSIEPGQLPVDPVDAVMSDRELSPVEASPAVVAEEPVLVDPEEKKTVIPRGLLERFTECCSQYGAAVPVWLAIPLELDVARAYGPQVLALVAVIAPAGRNDQEIVVLVKRALDDFREELRPEMTAPIRSKLVGGPGDERPGNGAGTATPDAFAASSWRCWPPRVERGSWRARWSDMGKHLLLRYADGDPLEDVPVVDPTILEARARTSEQLRTHLRKLAASGCVCLFCDDLGQRFVGG